MAELTPRLLTALEMLVGVRAPDEVSQETLIELVSGGWCRVGPRGEVIPTDTGVRATAPQHMRDVTPC